MFFKVERIKRILNELDTLTHINRVTLEGYRKKECVYNQGLPFGEKTDNWEYFKAGDKWGGKDKHFWFMTQISIPQDYDGKNIVFEVKTGKEGQWDAVNPQFLVYINEKPVQGLDVNHNEVLLSENAKANEVYNIALYAYSGMNEDMVDLHSCISILDKDIDRLFYNIKVPVEVAELLGDNDKRKHDILNYLTEAINMLDLRKPYSEVFYDSVIRTNKYLEDEFYEGYCQQYCQQEDIVEICVGHTHIDVAWMWTLAQTREKVARSFSTVLNLMKQYPEYIFMSSQPQLYKYVKEDHPDIYEQIKQRVSEGRWETEGAMWLEADCNLTSGESLVRQIIFGKRFFKEEFGKDNKILWLPDVFGYSAALPQILKKCGVDYFMTTKISWNEYNKMPYDTFMWRGLDGSEVMTHFISTRDYDKEQSSLNMTTYNGNINASQVMGCWQRYQHKDINNVVLNCFGYGDGGGGVTKEMLENARRLEKGIPGCPKVKMGTALEYFSKIDDKLKNNKKLPKWVGELYLECHRGTYTSMARNKRYNRKTEFLNLDTELLSTVNMILVNGNYAQKEINDCWETTLLNQFHDIIPGSSIKEVYEDSKRDYISINAKANEILNSAFSSLAANIKIISKSVIVFNQLSFNRNDIVKFKLPNSWKNVKVYDGEKELSTQIIEGNEVIFFGQDIPSKGYKVFTVEEDTIDNESNVSATIAPVTPIADKSLCNKYFEIHFDESGNITAIYDKFNNREILKPGEKGNVLQAFEDKPHKFDAWDINIYYQEKMWEINDVEKIEVTELGPVRTCISIKKRFLDSTIVQNIYIYNDIARIDFFTKIDWKEKQILLKAAFPVDISSNKATYEIQYGNVERPTHWNTSWDYAMFEVCAHKWADLSEGNYGISILNDCKYGHDIKDSVMRLTLLKSAVDPNIDADREVHEFTYSLYPHSGNWKQGEVVKMAYNLNCPLYTKVEDKHEGILPQQISFISIDCDNVIIEVVKKSENSDDNIVRMYECFNNRSKVICTLLKPLSYVEECDLLENSIGTVSSDYNSFAFEINPYEIKTFKIRF